MIRKLKGYPAFCLPEWRQGIGPMLRGTGSALPDVAGNALFAPEQPAPPSKKSFLVMSRIVVTLDVQRVTDGGMASAVASDVDGTWVPFSATFIAVSNVNLTPEVGLAATRWGYSPLSGNPTGFYVFFWDSAGNRLSGPFSWSVGGN